MPFGVVQNVFEVWRQYSDIQRLLGSKMQTDHMCLTHMPMTPFIWKRHILLIPSLIWTTFVALDGTSKASQNILKVKRQLRDVQRLFKLQNAKWSYVPTCMPMTPFTWRRHILVIFPLIWVIFVTLQSILKFKYNRMTFKDLLSYKMQTSHMCQPTCPWPPSLGEGISWSFLHRFEWFLLHWMC